MKADLTRSTDQPRQHYRAVRMQQGRVQLDADWNEQQDILNRRLETETRDTLGQGAGPWAQAGFKLTGNGQNIDIGAGRYYVEGLLCDNPLALTLLTQSHVPANVSPIVPAGGRRLALPPPGAAALNAIRVYDASGAAIAPEDGLYIGYLEAWLRHVTALEDPLIREVALGGPDTATRDQLVWQVKLLRAGDLNANLNCLSAEPWTSFSAAPDGKMAARAEPSTPPKDPCLLTPEAGFRRLENLLYRVEIHEDGSLGSKLRYKWSRDNGSIQTRVTRWLGEPNANEFEVASIGRDAYLAITAGCWLEFYSDTHDLLGQPGPLVQVLKTEGNVVTLDLASATGALTKAAFSGNPRVRRWDGWAELLPAAPNSANGWVELEDGVEIKFVPGQYRVADYWTVPARTATADVEWPREANKPQFVAPQGILRAFTRLAVLRCQGSAWTTLTDCRSLFPALSQLTNLYYLGGDGQQVMPDPLAPQPVALPSPLEVAVFNGQFPVVGAQVRFTATAGLLSNGSLSEVVNTSAEGVAAVVWRLAPDVLDQGCRAELLEAGQPVAGKYNDLHFSARLAVAAQVAYDSSKCPDMLAEGINTVQEALDALCLKNHGGGCCTSVGEGGEFATLDQALKTLVDQGRRDICLCLLPGAHMLSDSIDLGVTENTYLYIHGAGPASRLIVREQEFNLFNFGSVTLRDFEINSLGDGLVIRLVRCEEVRLQGMRLMGLTDPGNSLLQIEGAAQVELSGCVLDAYQRISPQRGIDLIKAVPLLAPFEASLAKDSLFAPVSAKVVDAFVAYTAAQRKTLFSQMDALLRNGTAPFNLDTDEQQALLALRTGLDKQVGQRQIGMALGRLRGFLLINQPGFALALADADADTLLTDNRLLGRLSLYGESSHGETLNDTQMKMLGAGIRDGRIQLLRGPGHLRLRNNRLREVRLGDEMFKQVQQAGNATGGGATLAGCYRSLVADANTLAGVESQLLAFDLALSQNVLERQQDIGVTLATQGKYLGNFAHNDFRLFAVGHEPEKFGNGGLNIVDF
ncbi:MAG: DUF6519 domain-containing protein [Pseudomonas sp.]|uniref:DUF6519 domain-containing protein n=1 Tax=Pseudomonas sp. TaxID=306 RepID=UPI00339996BA